MIRFLIRFLYHFFIDLILSFTWIRDKMIVNSQALEWCIRIASACWFRCGYEFKKWINVDEINVNENFLWNKVG